MSLLWDDLDCVDVCSTSALASSCPKTQLIPNDGKDTKPDVSLRLSNDK